MRCPNHRRRRRYTHTFHHSLTFPPNTRQPLSAQVRLKIADDNDLNTAKEALVTMAGFFVSISEEAAKRGGNATAFGVLQASGTV